MYSFCVSYKTRPYVRIHFGIRVTHLEIKFVTEDDAECHFCMATSSETPTSFRSRELMTSTLEAATWNDVTGVL